MNGNNGSNERPLVGKMMVAIGSTIFLLVAVGAGILLLAMNHDIAGIVVISVGLLVWSFALIWNAHSR